MPDRRKFLAGVGAGLIAVQKDFSLNSSPDKITPIVKAFEIDFLRKYPTTLLESALYLLRGSHDENVSTHHGLNAQTQNAETIVGYAVTSVFSTDPDDSRGRRENADYWNYVFGHPGPKIAVSLDASREPGSGSSWGQQNAYIHQGLGCRGVLTNGGVRDIQVFREISYAVFSGSLTIGHGNPHFIEFGQPVMLYGAQINSGDIVCADEHGAVIVPKEFLPDIEAAAAENQRRTNIIADYSRRKDFTPQELAEITRKLKLAAPWRPAR